MTDISAKRDMTLPEVKRHAKGRPGVSPSWTSGAKTIVGTARSERSRVWFTVNNGAIAEVYYPDLDTANTRVIRFLITSEDGFFSDEIWDAEHRVRWLEEGVPGCLIETRCKQGRYVLLKEIITDPSRDVLLIRVRFLPAEGQHLRLSVAVDPHVGDQGAENQGWAGDYLGVPMLFATEDHAVLAIAALPALLKMSVGYIGKTDAYTLLRKGKPLPDTNWAEPGNVSLAAELDLSPSPDGGGHECVLAVGFGGDAAEAAHQARCSLLETFETTKLLFQQQWLTEQARYASFEDISGSSLNMYRVSTAMLETHRSKRFAGGFVASLSLPWGFARNDKDVGGYHVVWPRDLVEIAMGKLACGDSEAALAALKYLACTQQEGGGWCQNMWLDGTPYLTATQMDSIALPILLGDRLHRDGALHGYDPVHMSLQAAKFLLLHGPVTDEDRWESLPGYSPFTMAAQVAALLASAQCADRRGHTDQAEFLRQTADAWNDAIDELIYVSGTDLARQHGVDGYYVRIAPPSRIERNEMGVLRVKLSNLPFGSRTQLAANIISPDALALVRFGLRAPDDPKIKNTVKIIDETLRYATKTGPAWRRSTKDGYGEKSNGDPFVKTGEGRGWPLLAGERGHYELANGSCEGALDLLKTMGRQTSECGMIPEQIWDGPDMAEKQLYNGLPSGSGMPLAWAHAEYVKLLRSLHEGAVWDQPPQTTERYIRSSHHAPFQIWRPNQKRRFLTEGKNLRIDLEAPARVTWNVAGTKAYTETLDSGLGLHTAVLPLAYLRAEDIASIKIEGPYQSRFQIRVIKLLH